VKPLLFVKIALIALVLVAWQGDEPAGATTAPNPSIAAWSAPEFLGDAEVMDLDYEADGTIHLLARENATSGALFYFQRTPDGTWSSIETVVPDVGNVDPPYAEIAVTPDGVAHVAYLYREFQVVEELRYRRRLGTNSWSTAETLSAGGVFARNPNVEADSLGNVHVLWSRSDSASVNYRRRAADGNWTAAEAVDQAPEAAGGPLEMLVEPQTDRLHIFYGDYRTDASQRALMHRIRSAGGTWLPVSPVMQDFGGGINAPTSLHAGLGMSVLHATWMVDMGGNGDLYVNTFAGGAWQTPTKLNDTVASWSPAGFSVGTSGRAAVWGSDDFSDYRMWSKNGAAGSWEEIAGADFFQGRTSIIVDPFNQVHALMTDGSAMKQWLYDYTGTWTLLDTVTEPDQGDLVLSGFGTRFDLFWQNQFSDLYYLENEFVGPDLPIKTYVPIISTP
jgi:hypothetical protein